MKNLSVKSDFADQEETVFDTTPCGKSIAAERDDEPGAEHPQAGDGDSGEGSPGRHLSVERILHGDPEGNWSWKPNRQDRDPGYALTREEIDAWVAAGQPRLRQETPERIAQLESQMSTFKGVPKGMAELHGLRILS